MKTSIKGITQTGLLLAICIASQFMKNLSVYITGPIVNLTMILAALMIGLSSGLMIAVIAPLTSFWLAPSPILIGIPWIIPCIIIGNCMLVLSIWLFRKFFVTYITDLRVRVALGLIAGTITKALFMGVTIAMILLPLFGSNINVPAQKLTVLMSTAKVTFSVTQLITAAIASVLGFVIWLRIRDKID